MQTKEKVMLFNCFKFDLLSDCLVVVLFYIFYCIVLKDFV